MDGTVNAGRKGIAYLRDYYKLPAAADAVDTETTDEKRTLVTASAQQG